MINLVQVQYVLLFLMAMVLIPVALITAEEQQKHYDIVHQEMRASFR